MFELNISLPVIIVATIAWMFYADAASDEFAFVIDAQVEGVPAEMEAFQVK